jgi:Uma2 family endonuclease
MPTEAHGVIAALIAHYLLSFVLPRGLGRVGVEVRIRLDDDPRNVRLPDVIYSAGTQPVQTRGSLTRPPEMAIEIKSPDDSIRALRASASYYLAHGCRMVWLILPEQRIVEVYTPQDDRVLTVTDTLTGGDVLPGFTLPVAEIFRDMQTAIDNDESSQV